MVTTQTNPECPVHIGSPELRRLGQHRSRSRAWCATLDPPRNAGAEAVTDDADAGEAAYFTSMPVVHIAQDLAEVYEKLTNLALPDFMQEDIDKLRVQVQRIDEKLTELSLRSG